jgi:hypothetical protein
VFIQKRYKRQDMQSRSLTNPKADVLFHPDTNDIRIVSKLLEYEFDKSDIPVRLSLDEIKERLPDISDDILKFSLKH